MMTLFSVAQSERYNTAARARPMRCALAFFLIVIVLRSLDLFVLHADALPDPTIFSKIIGFTLVVGYLYVLRKPISTIGLHARNVSKAVFIGMMSLMSLYVILYSVQFFRLSAAGQTPQLVFAAIDTKTGAVGRLFFTAFLLFGQLVNAFMEESIFRGVMLSQLMRKFRFWNANVLQAILFGCAHLVFPLSSWISGHTTAGQAAAEAAVLLVFTTIGGLVFGYLYYRTASLWTAVFAHLIDNSSVLFFHIQTANSVRAEADMLPLASIGFIALMLLAWIVAKRCHLPPLKPWGTASNAEAEELM